MKEFCKSFFDKAAKKHKEREKAKAQKKSQDATADSASPVEATPVDHDADVKMSDDESSVSLKRKRDGTDAIDQHQPTRDEGASTPSKRQKSTPPPPPPGGSTDTLMEEALVASAFTPPPPPSLPKDYQNANGNGYTDSRPESDTEMTDVPSHIQVEGQV